MIRTFGLVTFTGNAQPLFGDTLTAAFNNIKNQINGYYTLTVANSTLYKAGDRWILGAGTATTNCVLVDHIIDSTHVAVTSEGDAPLLAWAQGTQLMLDIACSILTAQALSGNTGTAWVGADSTVTSSGGGSAFGFIPAGGAWSYGQGQWNTLRTSEFWIAGTASDQAGIAAVII